MEKQKIIKTQLSYSPNKISDNVFTMRARIGKKNRILNPKISTNQDTENNRPFSFSAQKNKVSASKLFRDAHKIDAKQTYLLNDKHKRSLTKQSTKFASPSHRDSKANIDPSILKILRKRSSSKPIVDNVGKNIQQTVEITITGKREHMPSQQNLMTTLSHIILGGERAQDDFYLQILGESSIHGDEENYIQMESFIFNNEDFIESDGSD